MLVSNYLILFVSVMLWQCYICLDFITCLSRVLVDFIYDVCSHMFITCCSRVITCCSHLFIMCCNGFYHVLVACCSHVVVKYLSCVVVDCITCCSHMFITNIPRVPTSPHGTRKKIQQTQHVTMPTGSRSLDKRTLASLVVVRHLGDADRRNM